MEQMKHRVLGLRAVAAVALASLIIGGGAGAALGALGDGADGGGPGQGQFRPPPNGQQDPSRP